MASTPDKVRAEALAMPADERASLAHELLASLDESTDPGAAQAWIVELERRARELDAGSAVVEDRAAVRTRWSARWPKR